MQDDPVPIPSSSTVVAEEAASLSEEGSALERLRRYWMDERSAPDLLRWRGEEVNELLEKLHEQVRDIEYGFT
jgi:hypothetical protein